MATTLPTASPGAASRRTPTASLAGVLVVLVGSFLCQLDYFVVNVALPDIGTDLRASPAALELVVAGYGVAHAMLLVLGGRLGDTYGRRRLFLIGLVGFVLTSVACGLAPTAGALIAARILQGAAAAALAPQVLATLQATLTGERRARALSFFAAGAGGAVVAGQLIGGVLVSADLGGTGWRGIFLVNLPVGLVGLLAAVRWLPETKAVAAVETDLAGTVLLTLSVLALLLPLTEGRALGWPVWSWLLLAAAGPLITAFVFVEARLERAGRTPLVPPSLLRRPGLAVGLGVIALFFACFSGFLFASVVALQAGAGFGPLASGLTFVPLGLAFLLASLLAPRLTSSYGRTIGTVGMFVQVVGVLGIAATVAAVGLADLNPAVLAPAMAVAGLGEGLLIAPLLRMLLASVPVTEAGAASGVVTTTQQTSLALGVAVLGGLFLAVAGVDAGGQVDPGADLAAGYLVSLLAETGLLIAAGVATRWLPRRTV